MAYIGRPNDPFLQEDPNLVKGMAYLYNDVMGKMAQANQQPEQEVEQPPAAYTQGLMPAFVEGATYQARPMPGEEVAQAQPKTLNQMARDLYMQGLQAKQYYQQGAAMGNEQGAQIMADSHNAAEQVRENLRRLGYGDAADALNGDYAQASGVLARNDMDAVQNVIDGEFSESSGMYYDRIYKILRDQGFSRDIAEAEAHNRAKNYASRRTQALDRAFNMYGRDNTTINPMGVQLLGMMAQEDTDMAGYYTQRYAGPLQEYADAKQQRNMATQQANKERTMAIGHSYDLENKSVDQQNRIQLKGIDAELNRAARAEDFQYRVMLLNMKAAAEAAKGGTGGNGVPTAQLKVWQEEVKRADEWDEKHIGQEKDNPYRASANAYKAMIDQSQGVGVGNGGSWAEYGDVPNDFNAFGRWVDAMFEKNVIDGYPKTNEQIIAIAESVNKEFADHYIDDSYRKPVIGNTESSKQPPTQSKPVIINSNNDNYGYDVLDNGPDRGISFSTGTNIAQVVRDSAAQHPYTYRGKNYR